MQQQRGPVHAERKPNISIAQPLELAKCDPSEPDNSSQAEEDNSPSTSGSKMKVAYVLRKET